MRGFCPKLDGTEDALDTRLIENVVTILVMRLWLL